MHVGEYLRLKSLQGSNELRLFPVCQEKWRRETAPNVRAALVYWVCCFTAAIKEGGK